MKAVITGATGFVGTALVATLIDDGHQVVALSRSPAAAQQRLPSQAEVRSLTLDPTELAAIVDGADAVIHLAGAPVAGRRWSAEVKKQLRDSRIGLADALVEAMKIAENRPAVFVSASAVGIYGDRGSDVLDETSTPGTDFLAQLCVDWEAAAGKAGSLGIRVVTPRLGIVLGKGGGALAKMLPAFSMGVGGRLGSGQQFMPWIHRDDVVAMMVQALADPQWRGPYNATAPTPVTNATFTEKLAKTLKRPALFPAPAFALKAVFGEGAAPLLTGQIARPIRALEHDFQFRFPDLDGALAASVR